MTSCHVRTFVMVRMVLWCAIRMETPYPACIQFTPEEITYLVETEVAHQIWQISCLARCVVRPLWNLKFLDIDDYHAKNLLFPKYKEKTRTRHNEVAHPAPTSKT